MHREIGMLTAKVDTLLEGMRRSEEKADASRASMHRQIETVTGRVGKVEAHMATIKEDVEEMKPTVDEVKAMKQRGIGALAVVGIAASMLTFLVTQYFGEVIGWVVRR